jgi:hypothetical protein
MIDPVCFTEGHIKSLFSDQKRDPGLVERTVFALGLLEAIARSALPFVHKGGSSMLLLLDEPRRFSTDVDILVSPGIDIESFLNTATEIWPFVRMAEQYREAGFDIEKRHFKFAYQSPLTGKEQNILLDVVYEENPYSNMVSKPISNSLLATAPPYETVSIPNLNCLCADKLVAFAPHTSGIRLNCAKELEIVKQLFDVSTMMPLISDFSEVKNVYERVSLTELSYRNMNLTPADVLQDSIASAACIASRGLLDSADYSLLKQGISGLANHVFGQSFNGEAAVEHACKVLYLAAAILSDQEVPPELKPSSEYQSLVMESPRFSKIGYIRKSNLSAYGYLYEASSMLDG